MTVALFLLTFAFEPDQQQEEETTATPPTTTTESSSELDVRSYLILIGMFAYIAGYQIGFGPITWLMISEVFPQSIRTSAVAISVQLNFALNAFVQFIVPILQTEFGLNRLFGLFGILTAYSIYFIRSNVPETKGLTLEQIEHQFRTTRTHQAQQQQQQPQPHSPTTDPDHYQDDNEESTQLVRSGA